MVWFPLTSSTAFFSSPWPHLGRVYTGQDAPHSLAPFPSWWWGQLSSPSSLSPDCVEEQRQRSWRWTWEWPGSWRMRAEENRALGSRHCGWTCSPRDHHHRRCGRHHYHYHYQIWYHHHKEWHLLTYEKMWDRHRHPAEKTGHQYQNCHTGRPGASHRCNHCNIVIQGS